MTCWDTDNVLPPTLDLAIALIAWGKFYSVAALSSIPLLGAMPAKI
jgi:hypothetical protein